MDVNDELPEERVRCVVVSGVSGTGKSTLADLLARTLGWTAADGDDFHPPANIEKMASGIPLSDQDRDPWLDTLGRWIDAHHPETGTVLTCSALRRRYRIRLAHGRPWLRFCHLVAPRAVLEERLAARRGHFMPASLLSSQLAALEPLMPREPGVTLDATRSPEALLADAVAWLDLGVLAG